MLVPFKTNQCTLSFPHRQEIETTLERLKRAERDLLAKEQQLRERELALKQRERDLNKQFKVVVRYLSLLARVYERGSLLHRENRKNGPKNSIKGLF